MQDYGHEENIVTIYATLYYCAFFDAMKRNREIQGVLKAIEVTDADLKRLSGRRLADHSLENQEIIFPDFIDDMAKVDSRLQMLYFSMAQALEKFVQGFSYWENADERTRNSFTEAVRGLPAEANARFHDYFLVVCEKYPAFYIYTQQKQAQTLRLETETDYQDLLSVALRSERKIDAGFASIQDSEAIAEATVKRMEETLAKFHSHFAEATQSERIRYLSSAVMSALKKELAISAGTGKLGTAPSHFG